MVKQRERVGQEAFLRAVAKGIKKSGHQEAGDQARSEILELASKIEEKSGAERRTRPFSLHLQDLASGESVKTPDLEALDISRMSDSLYELQSDIKKLALQQSQIQSMMQPSSSKQQAKPETSRQPFFISKPQEEQQQAASVSQNQPFYISPQPPPQQQPFHQVSSHQMPSSSVPQQLHNMMPMVGHQHHPPSSSPQPAAYHMSQHQPPVSQSPQPFHVSTNPGQRRTWGQPFDPVPHQQQFHHHNHLC